ncbi:hypothetical protein BU16DRAFT_148752 [Lophium mytilinum]|uniref:Uncharacterized protein n=1 Tax=Lophium mytilinum TaxID=390894 RepID=A0A6A6QDU3_9PEZI|nr:hypothetical protein BU16DRAFT_148752 [Lophium mytilinum]
MASISSSRRYTPPALMKNAHHHWSLTVICIISWAHNTSQPYIHPVSVLNHHTMETPSSLLTPCHQILQSHKTMGRNLARYLEPHRGAVFAALIAAGGVRGEVHIPG